MIPVTQDQNWNCQVAAIASILELPLEAMPAIHPAGHDGESFDEAWNEWLEPLGVYVLPINFAGGAKPKGYTVGVVPSQRFEDTLHAIVCLHGDPIHDPWENGRPYDAQEVESHLLFIVMDPERIVDRAKPRYSRAS